MTRTQLEHVIRAAAAVSVDDEIIIVGSQSILGAFPNAPAALTASMEADAYPKNPYSVETCDRRLAVMTGLDPVIHGLDRGPRVDGRVRARP